MSAWILKDAIRLNCWELKKIVLLLETVKLACIYPVFRLAGFWKSVFSLSVFSLQTQTNVSIQSEQGEPGEFKI